MASATGRVGPPDGALNRLSDPRVMARPVSPETFFQLAQLGGLLVAGAGTAGFLGFTAVDRLEYPLLLAVTCTVAVVYGSAFGFAGRWQSRLLLAWGAHSLYLMIFVAPLLVTAAQVAIGPASLIPMILYVEVPVIAVYLLPMRRVAVAIGAVLIEAALVLHLQPGYAAPWAQWTFLFVTLLTIGGIFGGMIRRAVEEALRMSRLRGFLPSQVADVILAVGDDDDVLAAQRAQVAVVFCDLRGFTGFAAGAEPEEVVEVLDEYFSVVGAALREAGATIGSYAGDGVMAFFNAPVAVDDPAGRAVRAAIALSAPMDAVADGWKRRGFALDYGIGIAFGYATLALVGFEERRDYTAVGTVVNLGARLCDQAGPGEILIDARTHGAVAGGVAAEPLELPLKGFPSPVTAYRVRRAGSDAGEPAGSVPAPPATGDVVG